jgi:acetoin utilization deacetylase AcuC-like enzyme
MCAGTLLTAELALQYGLACNTAGGTHHAFPAFGSGFCILNDLAITAEVLLQRGVVQRVLIVDLDVHQVSIGVGTPFFHLVCFFSFLFWTCIRRVLGWNSEQFDTALHV